MALSSDPEGNFTFANCAARKEVGFIAKLFDKIKKSVSSRPGCLLVSGACKSIWFIIWQFSPCRGSLRAISLRLEDTWPAAKESAGPSLPDAAL